MTKTKKNEKTAVEKILGPTGRKFSEDVISALNENENYLILEVSINTDTQQKIWTGEVNITLEETKLIKICESLNSKITVTTKSGKNVINICPETGHTEMHPSLYRDEKGFIRKGKIKKAKYKYKKIPLQNKISTILKAVDGESPLDIFWTYVLKLKNLPARPEGTKLNISAIYMHSVDYEILKAALKKWAAVNYKKSDEEKLIQAVTWALVDCAPNILGEEEEKNMDTGCLYIKENEIIWIIEPRDEAPLPSVLVDDRIPKTAEGHTIH
jgi:hypothetical protein